LELDWDGLRLNGGSLDLNVLRREYEKKRRREILTERKLIKRDIGSEEVREWSLNDEVGLKEEVEGYWPDWWGSKDDKGRSPWDHVPGKLEGGKKRVLFLTGMSIYINILRVNIRC